MRMLRLTSYSIQRARRATIEPIAASNYKNNHCNLVTQQNEEEDLKWTFMTEAQAGKEGATARAEEIKAIIMVLAINTFDLLLLKAVKQRNNTLRL